MSFFYGIQFAKRHLHFLQLNDSQIEIYASNWSCLINIQKPTNARFNPIKKKVTAKITAIECRNLLNIHLHLSNI